MTWHRDTLESLSTYIIGGEILLNNIRQNDNTLQL